ncbi:MAG: DUF4421 family protein, partial [Pseudobdellovibrio sp.]
MKITTNLYLNVISVVFIFLVSRIDCAQATEISKAAYDISPIIGFGQENFTFQVTDFDVNNKGKSVSFDPNIAGILRLGINAYGFGIGYSFREVLKDGDPRKGTTEFADLQLGYQTKNWGIDTYYQSYTGFFTSNTATIQSFPNLTFKHQGITGRYALQESDFSVNAMMDQADEVKSDSGKLYAVGGLHLYSMEVDVPLLQMENAGLDTELENLRKMKASSINLGLGYGYNWLYSNRLFIGVLIDLLGTYANYD